LKFLKINQQDGFNKINRIIDEIKDMRVNEEKRMHEMAKDFDMKYIVKKDKANPLLEERVNRL